MVPDLQATLLEQAGELVVLDPAGAVEVELHWQQWRLRTHALDAVAASVRAAAAEHLLPH